MGIIAVLCFLGGVVERHRPDDRGGKQGETHQDTEEREPLAAVMVKARDSGGHGFVSFIRNCRFRHARRRP